MKYAKHKHLYIGVDLHKNTHTAVIINCWNEILGEITFENRPSAFYKLIDKVNECLEEGIKPIFALEDTGSYGRSLAVYLKEGDRIVKEVNPALAHAQRMSNPNVKKNDNWDAFCVATVLLNNINTLPDADPKDFYWTLKQLVLRRNGITFELTNLKNRLHQQLTCHYPSYGKFFNGIFRNTALFFWETYPCAKYLDNVTVDKLAEQLRKVSHNACSTNKAKNILDLIKSDGSMLRDYQEYRDAIIKSIVRDIRFKQEEIARINVDIKIMVDTLDYKLTTIPGADVITASAIIAQIRDIERFDSPDKLARFIGIAPVTFSSGGKGKAYKSKQGNRELHTVLFFLALQQVYIHPKTGLQRNPSFYAYYQKKLSEGKTRGQGVVCIMRKLVNVIYWMMKYKCEYKMPKFEQWTIPLKKAG